MKNDLTTGAWQHDIGCPIKIVLVFTSDGMQQPWHGCSSKQHACVRQQAAAAGGMIAMDGMQPARMQKWAADAACMRQCAAAAACVRHRAGAAGSTIAMRYSDGSGQPAAQLQWAAAVAAVQRTTGRRKNCNKQRLQRWATVG